MTVALVDNADGTIAFGHVGDSRAYRVRGGELEQLTDDHSLVGELMRSGRLSPEEAETHPQRSVITRALGTEPDVDVDTFTVEAEPDDVYLLCSDGLTDMVSQRDILAAVEASARSRRRGPRARERRQRGRRRGQHHRRPLPDRRSRQTPPARRRSCRRRHRRRTTTRTRSRRSTPCPQCDTAVIPAAAIQEHLQQVEAEPRRADPAARAADRHPRRARRARSLGADALSFRNRELLNLIAVGLLTAIGFASVYIAGSSRRRSIAGSLTYAGNLHGAVPGGALRRPLPRRTPTRCCCRSRRCCPRSA